MKKSELIKELDDAIMLEEDAFEIYSEHVISSLDWSGLDDQDKKKITDLLGQARTESLDHKEKYLQIKAFIIAENKNVY